MAETYTHSERRKYPRFEVEQELLVFYKTPKTPQIKTSITKNISGGGLCFESEIDVSIGDILEITISKPADQELKEIKSINVEAKVVWKKQVAGGKYLLGSEFINIDQEHRDEIIKNVKDSLER